MLSTTLFAEPVCNTPRPRQRRATRTRGHPRPTPAFALPPVTPSAPAVPVLSTPAVTSTSAQPGVPGRPDKGKGRQQTTPPASPASSVDPSTMPAASSANLTPEQHLCLVWVLKHLDEWLARGWEPGVDQSCLQSLAEIFNSTEAVAEGGIADLRLADLAWRLADSEGWEKSAGSSIMGAIDIQVTVTKILYKDYGDALINSFHSFLGRKEAELVIQIRNQSFRRGFDSEAWTAQMEELVKFARKGMREADYLLTCRMPAFLRTMRRAKASLNILPLLVERLTGDGKISYSHSDSPLPELTPSAPSTPLLRSLTPRSCLSQQVVNFGTSLPVTESSPTPIPWEDIGVLGATPSVTGPPTMTEVVNQFMEDLLTQEFCPVLLDEDI
ncbi:hypothetical protein SCLCIDRAFT_33790 [Scleroderma citrinum Foug A]|uniref:Uncharacterized protein n=1 Tax=Scleroderma citrinum Foug A TaxID=1036808 RepID=A0A0C3CR20_9AGAM|nr:hypothetical protein SCLCIDRAFT_33790 [Scleroderma citrinum Foug A]